MDRKRKILELARHMGLIRPRDAEAEGIPREYLYRLCASGHPTRVGRGLYALPNALMSEHVTLAEVAKRAPNAIICLISALQFHNLTTQIPHKVRIAIENKRWVPKFDYPLREELEYNGIRVTLTGMLHQARIPLQVDIGFGDVVPPAPERLEFPTLLDAPALQLRTYSRYTMVAEKL